MPLTFGLPFLSVTGDHVARELRAVYRTCTLAATEAIDRYMDEGAKLARDVIARYGKER